MGGRTTATLKAKKNNRFCIQRFVSRLSKSAHNLNGTQPKIAASATADSMVVIAKLIVPANTNTAGVESSHRLLSKAE